MLLTSQQIDRLSIYYRTLTTEQLSIKFYVSHEVMRKTLSTHGIECPRRKANEAKTALIVKLWPRGTPEEIAEYVGLSPDAVRMRYSRAIRVRRWVQGLLFKLEPFTIPAPPMRIVHIATKTSRVDCVQLSIEFQEFQQQQLKRA